MNTYLFYKINGLASLNPWLDKLGIFLATWLAYVVIATLLVVALKHHWPKKLFILPFVSGIAARVLVEVIRFFYHHPRPFVVLSDVHKLANESSYSFPSGHASFFFALATSVYFYNKKLGWYFIIAAAMISVARIFVGIHWPYDILSGALLGIAIAFAVRKFATTKLKV